MRETPAIQAVRRKRPRPVKVRRWGSVQWGMNHEATAQKPSDVRTFIIEEHPCKTLKGTVTYTVGIGHPGAHVRVLVPRTRSQIAAWATQQEAREWVARKYPGMAEYAYPVQLPGVVSK